MGQTEDPTTSTTTTSLETKQNQDDDSNAVTQNGNTSVSESRTAQSSAPSWLRDDCLEFYEKELLPQAISVKDRVKLLRMGISRSMAVKKRFPDAQFLEFGVHEGKDLLRMAIFLRSAEEQKKKLIQQTSTFHGFDSFEGLPEDWINGQMTAENELVHKKGAFDTGGNTPIVNELGLKLGDHGLGQNNSTKKSSVASRILFHKGWFHETLPPFLDEHTSPVAFVHGDADLYASTLTFLTILCERKLLCKGTVIIFDEFWNYPHWQDGEFKAWSEIVEAFGLQYEYFGFHAPHAAAKSFKQFGYQSVGVIIKNDMK